MNITYLVIEGVKITLLALIAGLKIIEHIYTEESDDDGSLE